MTDRRYVYAVAEKWFPSENESTVYLTRSAIKKAAKKLIYLEDSNLPAFGFRSQIGIEEADFSPVDAVKRFIDIYDEKASRLGKEIIKIQKMIRDAAIIESAGESAWEDSFRKQEEDKENGR